MIIDMFDDNSPGKREYVVEETKIQKLSPFDIVRSINSGERIEFQEQEYSAFLINRALSFFPDTIQYANLMNQRHNLSPDMQYDFLMSTIRPKKRYGGKWGKKDRLDDILFISKLYSINKEKAAQYLSLLSEADLQELYNSQEKGGAK